MTVCAEMPRLKITPLFLPNLQRRPRHGAGRGSHGAAPGHQLPSHLPSRLEETRSRRGSSVGPVGHVEQPSSWMLRVVRDSMSSPTWCCLLSYFSQSTSNFPHLGYTLKVSREKK